MTAPKALSSEERSAGLIVATFRMLLAPGAWGEIVCMCSWPSIAHRLVVSPLCASSVRVMGVRAGVEPLLPWLGGDGVSGTMFPPLPIRDADRVAPWTNVSSIPCAPGMPWGLEVENRSREPVHADAVLFGTMLDNGRRGG